MSVSNMWLGDLKNYSAERIAGKGQIFPHASMVLREKTAKPLEKNALFNPFPDHLRMLQGDEQDEVGTRCRRSARRAAADAGRHRAAARNPRFAAQGLMT